jgi:hypothetical protein
VKIGENSIYNYSILLIVKAPVTTFRMNKLDLPITQTCDFNCKETTQAMRVMAWSGAVRLNEMAETRGFFKTELKYHKFIVHATFCYSPMPVPNEYGVQTAGE